MDGRRLEQHDLEVMRRSLAMSPGLPTDQIERLIETCSELLAERVRIERILSQLAPSWSGSRRALNDLYRVLHPSRSR